MLDLALNPVHGVLPVDNHEFAGVVLPQPQPLSAAEAFWFDGFGVGIETGVALFGHESSGRPRSARG